MRYKHILTVIFASLPILMIIRALQLIKHTDHTTGFYTKDKQALVVTVAIAIVAFLVVCCCATVKRAPLKTPKVRKPLAIGAVLMAVAVALDVVATFGFSFMSNLHKFIIGILGLLTVAFFVAYAIKGVKKYRLEKLLYAIPAIYFAAKLVLVFISIATLALISANAYMILYYSFTTLFFLEFAKIANGYDKEKSYKKILITAALSAMFSAVFSVPQMFLLLTDSKATLHQSSAVLFSAMLTGVFVMIYIMAHFSNKNLKNHHYRKKKGDEGEKFLNVETPKQEFYYGD